MADVADLTVRDNPEGGRYEVLMGGELVAVADYHVTDGRMVLPHTEVVPQHRGRGIGDQVAKAALDGAREKGLLVVPSCWFIREYIDRTPGYGDLLA